MNGAEPRVAACAVKAVIESEVTDPNDLSLSRARALSLSLSPSSTSPATKNRIFSSNPLVPLLSPHHCVVGPGQEAARERDRERDRVRESREREREREREVKSSWGSVTWSEGNGKYTNLLGSCTVLHGKQSVDIDGRVALQCPHGVGRPHARLALLLIALPHPCVRHVGGILL